VASVPGSAQTPSLALPDRNSKPFAPEDAVDALAVDVPAFAPEHCRHAPVAVARVPRRNFQHTLHQSLGFV